MKRKHWSIRNYNAFLRQAKTKHKLSHKEAQALYRSMKQRLGRPVFAKDLTRHPRITKQQLREVQATIEPIVPEFPAPPIEVERPPITSVEQWLDIWEPAWDYEDEYILEGTAEDSKGEEG